MKKLAITMMSLVMIMLVVPTVHSVNTNEKPPANDPGITYVVNIELSSAIGLCNSYYVTISDRDGNLVASPLPYQEGTNTYIFHENGPVTGTRTANLVEMDKVHHACTHNLYTQPDIKNNRFRNNVTYLFTLHPTRITGDE